MTRRLQNSCTEANYQPDCDDYDPRKPEYVKPATDCEVAWARSELLSRQARNLERSIARRDKHESPRWFFSRKRAHYKRMLGDMREELQQGHVVLPEPSGKARDQPMNQPMLPEQLGKVRDQLMLPALCGWQRAMSWSSVMKTLLKTLGFWRSNLRLHFLVATLVCIQDLNVKSHPDLALGAALGTIARVKNDYYQQ
mmetsp:Transcript_66324/g.130685  ORF Transcript_66324/g.130685 Transcript_66324/m.130685 type:complete len:197 (-) Transcript_66324:194-784(-)